MSIGGGGLDRVDGLSGCGWRDGGREVGGN